VATVLPRHGGDFVERRLSLDWVEGGGAGHLEATSTDGSTDTGRYGYGSLDDHRRVQFTLFRSAAGDLLFAGRWWNTSDGGGGEWALRLSPVVPGGE
jgi:hypothetical protein